MDVYLTKRDPATMTPAGTDPTWEVAVYNAADAAAPNAPFPYTPLAGATNTEPLTVADLSFDPNTGALKSGSPVSFTIPNGKPVTLDMSQTTQLATTYTILQASTNGNAPSQVASVNIAPDGTLSTVYQNGATVQQYTIPIASVVSPDNMTIVTGNAFLPNSKSGAAQIGKAGVGGVGTIKSSALEASTVDLASELAQMISAQNDYQANSKVFQTGSQLLQVLINLKQ